MKNLALTDFAEGTVYQVESEHGEHDLTLESATELLPSIRPEGSFRLAFRGPPEPILQQAIYPLRRGKFACQMFLVPLARDDSGTLYEAIFN